MKYLLILLTIAVFISALELIMVRHNHRLLFTELQTLQQERDTLNEQWGQWQLEQSTLSQPYLIEAAARTRLNMFPPAEINTIVIHP